MPSASLVRWTTIRSEALDELESAHRIVGGTGRGRRYATQQINQAYAVLLSSQFQGFCRDLHTECIDFFVPGNVAKEWQVILQTLLRMGRKLDSGNPNPSNIGSDFNRFGILFWAEVRALDSKSQDHKDTIEVLALWRNAIAHQDFSEPKLGRTSLWLVQVKCWRRACDSLAATFDEVMANHIQSLAGQRPW